MNSFVATNSIIPDRIKKECREGEFPHWQWGSAPICY